MKVVTLASPAGLVLATTAAVVGWAVIGVKAFGGKTMMIPQQYPISISQIGLRTSSKTVWSPSGLFPSRGSRITSTTTTTTTKLYSSSPLDGITSSKTYEQLLEKLPSASVVTAVSELSNGQSKVVASDIATRAGVSLSQARQDLTTLASLTRGDIGVSADGDLVYQFPPNLPNVLATASAKYKALQTFEKVWPTVFWGIRVSFGVALLASVVLIFSTIFFIQSSSNSSDDRDERRRDSRGGFGGGMGGMGFWGPSPFDFFYYRPYGYYGYYGTPAQGGGGYKDPEEMGFFESIFSYIFGDGNPNQTLEEKRLALVAQMIRSNNGAVTAEQLAPYCDAPNPTDASTSSYIDESFVLPIVTQLDGEPRVTEDGDIVYVFPELQVSASSSTVLPATSSSSSQILKRAGLSPNASTREIQQLLYMNRISTKGAVEKQDLLRILEGALPPKTKQEEEEESLDDPTLLQEREHQFSLAPDLYKFLAGGLGVVNLGGALYLGSLLGQYAAYGVQLPSYFGVVQSFYPLLLSYAVLFNIIPIVRNICNRRQNSQIQQRNAARRAWRKRLQDKAGRVGRKLQSAAQFATRRKTLQAEDMIYDSKTTTAKDLQQQAGQKALDEFDQLLSMPPPKSSSSEGEEQKQQQLSGASMETTIPPLSAKVPAPKVTKESEEEPFQ
jgi:hypothetical protein